MENLKYVLEMENISKEFPGVKALDNVQLKLKPGTVHALMGENGAGKSTLMKCLFGIYEKNSGKILLDGVEVNFKSTKEALENGVSMVHQELNQVLQRNVLDNIWLGRYPMKGFFVDEKKMYNDTINIFKDLDIKVDPRKKVADLPIAERQMIEIAKAVSYKSKVIVMDEPTSSLTEKEVDHLFKIIKKLKESGVGIVYISHKMEEIKMISDEITILRDGKWISTNDVSKISTEQIISMMVGRDLTERFPKKDNTVKEMILEVKNLTALNQPSIQDVSFELYKGEILGIAGLVGSKRTEIVETIFGIRPKEKGEIILNGQNITAIEQHKRAKWISQVYQNPTMGTAPSMTVLENLSMAKNKGKRFDFTFGLDTKNIDFYKGQLADIGLGLEKQLHTQVGLLSGGQRQCLSLIMATLNRPDILLLDEHTAALDPETSNKILEKTKEIIEKNNITSLMITHNMQDAITYGNRLIMLHAGEVIFDIKGAEKQKLTVEKLLEMFKTKDAKLSDKDVF